MSLRAIAVILCLTSPIAAGCMPEFRMKGRLSLYSVSPTFRPLDRGPFTNDDISWEAVLSRVEKSETPLDKELARRMGLTDAASITKARKEATDDPEIKGLEIRSAAAYVLNDFMLLENLPSIITLTPDDVKLLPDDVRRIFESAKAGSADKNAVPVPDDLRLRLNRVLLQTAYRLETLTSQKPVFSGGYLKGAFAIARDERYAIENAIYPNEGYRFSFDNIHVRYTQKGWGANFLVYVEMYRGVSLKPFYVQVIARETNLPRNTSVRRDTVMTPAFTYEKDEPILVKIVGIDLRSPELEKAGNTLSSVDNAAKELAGIVPAAQFVPVLTKLTGTLYELAVGSNDIEFQYAIAFYPYQSPQIKVPVSAVGKGWEDYFAEIPLIGGQFVLIKDEDEFRRVQLDSWWEALFFPITRLIPSVAWWLAALVGEPIYILAYDSHFSSKWRYPGLWDEVVDGPSYKPIEDPYKLVVFNTELRIADKSPEELRFFKEVRPTKESQFRDKTHVLFSVLRTDEGKRDPREQDAQEHVKQLADLGIPRTATNTAEWANKLGDLAKEAKSIATYKKVKEGLDNLDKDSPELLKHLMSSLRLGDARLSELLVRDLNRATGQVKDANYYLDQLKEVEKGQPLPYEFIKKLGRWQAKSESKPESKPEDKKKEYK